MKQINIFDFSKQNQTTRNEILTILATESVYAGGDAVPVAGVSNCEYCSVARGWLGSPSVLVLDFVQPF